MRNILFLIFVFYSTSAFSNVDWDGPKSVITDMYIYPTYTVIVQSGTPYIGKAGCSKSTHWSFYWADFDEQTQERIYSTLLAAYMSKTPIKPIFTRTDCGPENMKKFTGEIVL